MNIFQELRHAIRTLRKTPAFVIAALVVLALGIGANTAIFSIVYGVLLRPLPFADPERLVQLWHVPPQKSFPGMTRFALSAANYLDWEQQNDVFDKSAIYSFASYRLTGRGEPQVLRAARVEPTFFQVLGVKPVAGRVLEPGDDQPDRSDAVVLSHALWQTQFGGETAIVGRSIVLDGQKRTVVGVMPPTLVKPGWAMLWTPLVWTPGERAVRGEHHFLGVARLKPDVSVRQAQTELDTIARRLAEQYPADNAGWGALVVPLREETVGDVRKALLVLLGAVGFVLLIACANVANLMIAKTLDRRKEIAIRTALGAGRGRIIAQVLSEALLLSLAGGALGLIVAHYGTTLVVRFLGSSLPRMREITLDAGVLAFTFAVAVVTGIATGAAPAWRLSSAEPGDALKEGGRTDAASGGRRLHNALVVAEVALSLVLLAGAGLMIRTLANLRNTNPGFDPGAVLTMTINVSDVDYKTIEQEVAFIGEALRRVRTVAGVQAAGVTDDLPLEGGSNQPVAIEGRPELAMADQPEVSVRVVSPGFFPALRIPLRRGRDFTDADNATAPKVVIVSESMAKRFWPGEDAIGKRLKLTFFPDAVREVAGIVGDVKDRGLDKEDPNPTLYWPVAQVSTPAQFGPFRAFPMELAVRTATPPAAAASAIEHAIRDIAPAIPLVEVRTMEDRIVESIAPQRFNMFLLVAFAGVALLLAAVGIYSVLAYMVRRRFREIGIRVALGASAGDVVRTVLGEGLRPTLVGIAIGVAGALTLGRVVNSLIYGVRVTDALTMVSASTLLMGVALAASALPAYRATRVDPIRTLREE
jgi:putative ABC transport system permease protein